MFPWSIVCASGGNTSGGKLCGREAGLLIDSPLGSVDTAADTSFSCIPVEFMARGRQITLIVCTIALSWLLLTAIHEAGHVLHASGSGYTCGTGWGVTSGCPMPAAT
jgi:hypothetical protein